MKKTLRILAGVVVALLVVFGIWLCVNQMDAAPSPELKDILALSPANPPIEAALFQRAETMGLCKPSHQISQDKKDVFNAILTQGSFIAPENAKFQDRFCFSEFANQQFAKLYLETLHEQFQHDKKGAVENLQRYLQLMTRMSLRGHLLLERMFGLVDLQEGLLQAQEWSVHDAKIWSQVKPADLHELLEKETANLILETVPYEIRMLDQMIESEMPFSHLDANPGVGKPSRAEQMEALWKRATYQRFRTMNRLTEAWHKNVTFGLQCIQRPDCQEPALKKITLDEKLINAWGNVMLRGLSPAPIMQLKEIQKLRTEIQTSVNKLESQAKK